MMKVTNTSQSTKNDLAWSNKSHLINTKDLTKSEVIYLLERAKYFKHRLFGTKLDKAIESNKESSLVATLAGKIAANLFYENSTRTRLSFELASKHLGMHVLNLDVSRSSVQKGESLEDTAKTLAAMGVNVMVQRHSESGSAAKIADATNNKVHVINAGEGTSDHPTQALLDLFTLLEASSLIEQADLSDKKIVIVGDVLHSRVASANMCLLPLFGAKIHLVGPAQLMPQGLAANNFILHSDLNEALTKADFVMAIRPQFERQEKGIFGAIEKYVDSYQINHERLKLANPSVKVYAPGPINRDIEISGQIADDHNLSLIEKQVRNGVPIRMAVIEALCKTD